MTNKKQSIPTYIIPVLVILAFTIIGFSFYTINMLDPGGKPGPIKGILSFGKADIGGKFNVKDMHSNEFTEANLKGKITLIYFGFASCPDICPATLQTISHALAELPQEDLDRLQVLFVSVDPERDDMSQLKNFVSAFHPKILGLTGSKEQIQQMSKIYKVYYNKIEPKKDEDQDTYVIDHSSIIYMLDRNGQYLKHFSSKATFEEIAQEVGKELQ